MRCSLLPGVLIIAAAFGTALGDGGLQQNNIDRNIAIDPWGKGLDNYDNIRICKKMCVSVGCHGIWDKRLASCSCIVDFSTKELHEWSAEYQKGKNNIQKREISRSVLNPQPQRTNGDPDPVVAQRGPAKPVPRKPISPEAARRLLDGVRTRLRNIHAARSSGARVPQHEVQGIRNTLKELSHRVVVHNPEQRARQNAKVAKKLHVNKKKAVARLQHHHKAAAKGLLGSRGPEEIDQADGPNNGENRRHPLRNNFKEAKGARRSSIITQPPDLIDSNEDDVVNQ